MQALGNRLLVRPVMDGPITLRGSGLFQFRSKLAIGLVESPGRGTSARKGDWVAWPANASPSVSWVYPLMFIDVTECLALGDSLPAMFDVTTEHLTKNLIKL